MKQIIILFAVIMLVGCMARTEVMIYGPDGNPAASFFDNKSRQGFEITLEPQKEGPPRIIYKCDIIDANSVAMKALGVAEKTADLVAKGLLP